MASLDDGYWMQQAVAEARRGLGRTAPNPAVGCVVVRSGRELGRGWHRKAGLPHAEIDALRRCSNPRGATLYVTLEPCSHHGRTGPCADQIIASKVARVVVGSRDPNPKVSGSGIRRLRRAGLQVQVGVGAAETDELIVGFAKHVVEGIPWVHMKMAVSLDGRIASRTGASKWISNETSRARSQSLRARSDAILVGIGTVQADDPRLNCRIRGASNPLRVILDPRLQTPPSARVVRGAGASLIVTEPGAPANKRRRLESAGAEVVELTTRGRRGWTRLLKELGRRDVLELLIEGGAGVAASAVRAAAVNRLTLFYNPRLIGGDGIPMIESLSVGDPAKAPRLKFRGVEKLDGDIVWSGDFL